MARAVCAPAPCTTSAPPRAPAGGRASLRRAADKDCARAPLRKLGGGGATPLTLYAVCMRVRQRTTPRAPPRRAARGFGIQGLIRFLVHWKRLLCAALVTSQQALSGTAAYVSSQQPVLPPCRLRNLKRGTRAGAARSTTGSSAWSAVRQSGSNRRGEGRRGAGRTRRRSGAKRGAAAATPKRAAARGGPGAAHARKSVV